MCSTYLLNYSLHGAESFLRSYLVLQLIKKFPAFYWTRRFITAFTSARHLSLSWGSSIQSVLPLPTFWRSILILSSIYAWVFEVVSFSPVSLPKPCINLSSPPYGIHAPPVSFFSIWSPKQYLVTSTVHYLHFPVPSSLLRQNILLSTLFSKTLSHRSSLNVNDQVSHPYKTRGKIIVSYLSQES